MNTPINGSKSCNSGRFYGISEELYFTIDYILCVFDKISKSINIMKSWKFMEIHENYRVLLLVFMLEIQRVTGARCLM